MKNLLLIVLLFSSFAYSQTDCVAGNGGLISVLDSKGVATAPQYSQAYKANAAAILLSQKEGRASIKTPDIVCTTKQSSSSSSRASSASSVSSAISVSSVSSQASSAPGAVTVYENDFNSGSFGDSYKSNGVNISNGVLTYTYPVTGYDYPYFGVDISQHNSRSVCAEFDARMPGNKHGSKFFKVFSQNVTGRGYANSTFQLEGDNGEMNGILLGIGSDIENDAATRLLLNGDYRYWQRNWQSVVWNKVTDTFQWSNNWHHMKLCMRFNSGDSAATEVQDGAYRIEIDGVVRLDVRNIFNRHYLNLPIEKVELFGVAQSTGSFEIQYDNLKISIGDF